MAKFKNIEEYEKEYQRVEAAKLQVFIDQLSLRGLEVTADDLIVTDSDSDEYRLTMIRGDAKIVFDVKIKNGHLVVDWYRTHKHYISKIRKTNSFLKLFGVVPNYTEDYIKLRQFIDHCFKFHEETK